MFVKSPLVSSYHYELRLLLPELRLHCCNTDSKSFHLEFLIPLNSLVSHIPSHNPWAMVLSSASALLLATKTCFFTSPSNKIRQHKGTIFRRRSSTIDWANPISIGKYLNISSSITLMEKPLPGQLGIFQYAF